MDGALELFSRLRSSRFARRVADFFVAYRADEPVAAGFRARQLQAVLRLTPITLFANAVNVILIAVTFWPDGKQVFLLLWALAIAVMLAGGTRAWLRWRNAATEWRTASRRAMRRATGHATALASMWALMPVMLFSGASGPQQLLVSTVTVGMLSAGGFALATVPVAGTAYVLTIGAGGVAMLWGSGFPMRWDLAGLMLIYTLIAVGAVWINARLFGGRLMAEAESQRRNEVIGLLLRDFEENASDVLWEIDAKGHLCHVSPRLVESFGLPAHKVMQQTILELLQALVPDDESSQVEFAQIRRHLGEAQPFRDLPLALGGAPNTRWWSMSAKPLLDAAGRCTGWRGVAADITDAHRANRQLTWMAHNDALTGLCNRHQFRSQLGAMLKQPAGLGGAGSFALLCLDLDHFKTINDTLGHSIGDDLLQEVARRLGARTRRNDTVARVGGDEFAVILRNVSTTEEAETLTRRLLDGLQAPCEVQGARIAVRTSIGVAMAPRDGSEIDTLLNNADLALYAAKSAGRGEFRFFAPDMATLTRRRLVIEQELREALARKELSLAFQPQVRLSDWQVTGFEALLRWHHPELGHVSPAEFVPVAEESGLIAEIGQWVLAEACRQAAAWPGELMVSVNVSPVQAMSQDVCRVALDALHASGLPASRLELEITESIFLNETGSALQSLHALHAAGMRVALDDFGTGYSSLAYLRRFPFDTLKIDRSFIRESMSQPDARAIVKMIVGLARTLKMQIVAEGVEEASQVGVLNHYGCDSMQGFLVARPMPAAQVRRFLADWSAQPPMAVPEASPTAPMPLSMVG